MKRTVSEATLTTATFEGYVKHEPPDDIILMTYGVNTVDRGWALASHALSSREPLFIWRIVDGTWQRTALTVWNDGNVSIGNYTAPGDNAQNALVIPDGVAPTTNVVGGQIYAISGEIYTRDGSGNITNISPHNFEQITLDEDDAFPVVVNHKNPYLGIEESIYLSKLARLVEDLTGEKLVWSRNLSPSETRDFAADEQLQANRQQQAIIAHQELLAKIQLLPEGKREEKLKTLPPAPEPYTQKPIPQWIKDRLDKRPK